MTTAPIFFNSAWVHKPKKLVLPKAHWQNYSFPVRWGLIPQTPIGPVIIDTGYSADITTGKSRSLPLKIYNRLLKPELLKEGQIVEALKRFSLKPEDIAAVIVTHLHADHIAALKNFPNACFFTSRTTAEELNRLSSIRLWHKGIFKELLPADFNNRIRFIEDCPPITCQGYDVYDLFRDGSLLALPLPGHATGHFGLIWPKHSKPLLYGVDAEWLVEALSSSHYSLAARFICADPAAAKKSAAIIRDFVEHGFDLVLCHDAETGAYDG